MEEEYTMTVNHTLPCQPIQSRCSSVQMEASPLCTGGSHAETGRSSLGWKEQFRLEDIQRHAYICRPGHAIIWFIV